MIIENSRAAKTQRKVWHGNDAGSAIFHSRTNSRWLLPHLCVFLGSLLQFKSQTGLHYVLLRISLLFRVSFTWVKCRCRTKGVNAFGAICLAFCDLGTFCKSKLFCRLSAPVSLYFEAILASLLLRQCSRVCEMIHRRVENVPGILFPGKVHDVYGTSANVVFVPFKN